MCDLLIFGGTTEGRLLAEFCCANEIGAYVSVATEYGAELLPRSEQVHVLVGRADSDGIADMIKKHNISVVIDATHPYAEEVSRNIQRACSAENTIMYRIKRNDDEECANAVYFNSIGAAVSYLDSVGGNALITTGSKELSAFTAVHDFKNRLTVRVLDSAEIKKNCEALGFSADKIIAEKGPFSEDRNIAHINMSGAKYVVTKDSGKAGGFAEKVSAANACNAKLLIIKRPEETGLTLEETEKILLERYSVG